MSFTLDALSALLELRRVSPLVKLRCARRPRTVERRPAIHRQGRRNTLCPGYTARERGPCRRTDRPAPHRHQCEPGRREAVPRSWRNALTTVPMSSSGDHDPRNSGWIDRRASYPLWPTLCFSSVQYPSSILEESRHVVAAQRRVLADACRNPQKGTPRLRAGPYTRRPVRRRPRALRSPPGPEVACIVGRRGALSSTNNRRPPVLAVRKAGVSHRWGRDRAETATLPSVYIH